MNRWSGGGWMQVKKYKAQDTNAPTIKWDMIYGKRRLFSFKKVDDVKACIGVLM